MFEAKCYDVDGNSIDGFTQWDIDQQITIKLEGCGKDHISVNDKYFSIAPEVHFSNVKRNKALAVRSTVIDKSTIVVSVPNILLTEPYPLLVYVYLTDNRNVSAQKTIVHVELPIKKRNEPDGYWYVENIERITAEMIKQEIEFDTRNIRTEAIQTITNTKNEAVSAVNTAVETAKNNIDSKVTSATNTISAAEQNFKKTAQGYIDEVTIIKNNTQTIHDDTLRISNETAAKIESNIENLIHQKGMNINIKEDGAGNITMTITAPQTNSQVQGAKQ